MTLCKVFLDKKINYPNNLLQFAAGCYAGGFGASGCEAAGCDDAGCDNGGCDECDAYDDYADRPFKMPCEAR